MEIYLCKRMGRRGTGLLFLAESEKSDEELNIIESLRSLGNIVVDGEICEVDPPPRKGSVAFFYDEPEQ